jgi:rhamnosyl/mannosyltransferase
VSVLEALSCETPVIASNIGGIPEIVENYKNGILFPPNNALRLAEAIQYLLENENVRKKFGQEGKQRIAENFSSEIIVKRICKLYGEMIACEESRKKRII